MAANAGRAMARRLTPSRLRLAPMRNTPPQPPQSSSMLKQEQRRSFRIPREIAALESMMPFHSTLASARLVSRLSGGLVPCLEGCRACSTSRSDNENEYSRGKGEGSESSEDESYSESESLWSQEEEEEDTVSENEETFGGDESFLDADDSFWDKEGDEGENDGKDGGSLVKEDSSRLEVESVLGEHEPEGEVDQIRKAEAVLKQKQGMEARGRREADTYLKAMKKEYDSRLLVQDEFCQKVHWKLANLRPDPDGKYRNLIDVVSDTDVLLEAYRRVKAGPGGDPSKISLDNISMDWFYDTQAKLRNGTFQLSPIKTVEIEKREIGHIERKKRRN